MRFSQTKISSRRVNIGKLVMDAGRPVLLVPPATRNGDFRRVLVGWKDTQASRRAVLDGLPFLARAGFEAPGIMKERPDKDESR